jgi:protein-S-isoprenylcysteine O-methyltransferase Ste14
MIKDATRDRLGFAFFAFVTVIASFSAWKSPSILAWLYVVHNLLLTWLYVRREPTNNYDRTGLWLGIIAAMLPTTVNTGPSPWYLMVPGFAGYGLILWSLVILGKRFGIAPADRGLTNRGPYGMIRHPMYLGEMLFRAALLFSSKQFGVDLILILLLGIIQCWRISLEERLISDYLCYTRVVPWRLLPGIW